MGDAINESENDGNTSPASARVIGEEFLKVLSRKEVEQPMIWHVTQSYPLPVKSWSKPTANVLSTN
jgi:hypothetical protein